MYMFTLSLMGIGGAITYLWLYIRQLEMVNTLLIAQLKKYESSK